MGDLSKHFNSSEFACPCCDTIIADPNLVQQLEMARTIANIPFVITSGYRCQDHNTEVGGVPSSAHTVGMAVDIKAENSESRIRILAGLLDAGFVRIGIGDSFIHADIDLSKPHPVAWLYT